MIVGLELTPEIAQVIIREGRIKRYSNKSGRDNNRLDASLHAFFIETLLLENE